MSMGRAVNSLIGRYGQKVSLCSLVEGKIRRRVCSAMMQYVKGTSAQYSHTPLGEEDGQKLLYLGEASQPLKAEGDWVLWDGRKLKVVSAHPVYCGTELAYWRGVLLAMAEDCLENEDYPWEEDLEEVEEEVEHGF